MKRAVQIILLILFLVLIPLRISAQTNGVDSDETLQTNPKDRENTVSLSISDGAGPTTPVLVSPTNSALITDSTPGFTWQEASDDAGIDRYILYLDGAVKFDSIPITATSNTQYTLTKSNNEYTLVPTQTITDATHTWKIRVVDTSENQKDSATWSFSVDTASPTLVITHIAELETTISAQDLSTLPDPYVSVSTNEVLLRGTSEANSSIALTVQVPSEIDLHYNIPVDSSGNWAHALPLLTRDKKITLTFVVTDLAGNVTVLNDVFLMITTPYIFSSPTQSPTSTQVNTSPGGSTQTDTTPSSSTVSENTNISTLLSTIPAVPPKEVVKNLLDRIIPENVIKEIPVIVKDIAAASGPIATALISATLPLTATTLVAYQFGWNLSGQVLIRIMQAIGILPAPLPQGVVYDSQTKKPVPFAILTITGLATPSTSDTLITNAQGVYGGVQLPIGKYLLNVKHQDYTFPSVVKRPNYLNTSDFYQGEQFEVTRSNSAQFFLVPIDPKTTFDTTKKALYFSTPLLRERLIRLTRLLTIPMFLVSSVIWLFFPTIINSAVCSAYLVILGSRAFSLFKIPAIRGKVVNDSGTPLENVFVRITAQQTNQLMSVQVTDKNGQFRCYLPKDEYQVSLSKQDFFWVENGQVQNYYVADARKSTSVILAAMADAHKVLESL